MQALLSSTHGIRTPVWYRTLCVFFEKYNTILTNSKHAVSSELLARIMNAPGILLNFNIIKYYYLLEFDWSTMTTTTTTRLVDAWYEEIYLKKYKYTLSHTLNNNNNEKNVQFIYCLLLGPL